jgi:Flp pilus assembly protein TadD
MMLDSLFTHRLQAALFWRILPLLLLARAGVCPAQGVVSHTEVERELRQAHYAQVLELTSRALVAKPRDPQMRFWHALSLDKLGQKDQALQAYRALTQDHPELPEPHNNLGVLLMAQGEQEAAKAEFEQALRMNADDVQALENLGDVLLVQARQLYERARQIGPERAALDEKINALPSPTLKP